MSSDMYELPSWLKEEQSYTPNKDKDAFLSKTILALFSLIEKFRQNAKTTQSRFNLCITFVGTIYTIILMSLSRNMIFTGVILAYVLLRLVFLNQKAMLTVMRSAITAALLSMIILLPAVFLGNPKSMLTISLKVFTSVSLLNCHTVSVSWNKLTESLRWLGIPDLFILILDLTLKYILELGTISLEITEALKLRSVGKNDKKTRALAGVIGIAFLKSREMSEEMYQAMVCRGFEGEYQKLSKFKVTLWDLVPVLMLVFITYSYIVMEGWMR